MKIDMYNTNKELIKSALSVDEIANQFGVTIQNVYKHVRNNSKHFITLIDNKYYLKKHIPEKVEKPKEKPVNAFALLNEQIKQKEKEKKMFRRVNWDGHKYTFYRYGKRIFMEYENTNDK